MLALNRSNIDRRSQKNRRRIFGFSHLFYKGSERRNFNERRSQTERRQDWVRVSKWSSIYLWDLRIAKFLK